MSTSKLCDKCNKEKRMYYRLYCPTCEAPKIDDKGQVNYIEILYFLERNYPELDFHGQLHYDIANKYDDFKNDESFTYHLHSEVEKVLFQSKELLLFEKYLTDLGLKDRAILWVSW